MQTSSREFEGIGMLAHEGRSRHWSGVVAVAGLPDPLDVSFDGTPGGPDEQQLSAVRDVLQRWPSILQEAESGLKALLNEAALPIPSSVWEAFTITGISAPSLSYDPHGAVHTFIDLVHVDYPDDFWPAIDVVNGSVLDVLSGT